MGSQCHDYLRQHSALNLSVQLHEMEITILINLWGLNEVMSGLGTSVKT